MTIQNAERIACPHGRIDCRDCDRYWWHSAIALELVRLRDECGSNGYNVPGIAGNIRGINRHDAEHYVAQMVAWGELEPCEPLFDYPATWVRLVQS